MASIDKSTSFMTQRQISVSAQEFLNHIFGNLPDGVFVEFTFIAPPGVDVPGPRVFTKSYALGQEMPQWEHFERTNADGWGVYYALTPKRQRLPSPYRRSKEADAAYCQVLWCDIDLDDGGHASKAEAYEAILSIHAPATVIVDSGGGLHALWRIEPVPVTEDTMPVIKRTLKGLALFVKGDPHVAELARVFRLPGTINTKPSRNGARCEVLDWLPGQLTLEDFEPYAALIHEYPTPRVTIQLPEGGRLDLPRWVQDYLESGAAPGSRNNRLYAAAIEYRANGYSRTDAERDLVARARLDGLSDAEIERTIDSAWRSNHGAANVPSHVAAKVAAQRRIGGAI